MLRAGSYRPEMQSLPVTDNTRMHVSHCLQAVYEEMISDSEREEYQDKVCMSSFAERWQNLKDARLFLWGRQTLG